MADPQGVQFEISVVGEETLETFTGKFRAKERYSWQDQLNIDRYRRELLGANMAEATVDVYKRATIVAELAAYLTEAPQFWKESRGGLDLIDDNVVGKVYEEAVAIREKWVKAQKEKGEKAKAALTASQGKK